ncbi:MULTISPECIES: hypothetical protein [unclassified Streptomyces]|uniref:hypothetical protein n=1 Tax=unclassified Streptomyces TaxID=2593676 RepID=UPI0027E2D76B|nr:MULTISPECIES: hypothetical protein [unclassified Streptomyces]
MADKPSEEPRPEAELKGPLPESSPIPDDAWEKFVQDAERDAASAPKEPSARARMVAERLRALDEAEARKLRAERRWGRKKAPAGQWQPQGWRTGPAWQEMNGRGSRRRTVWSALGVLLAVAVAVIALNPSAALSWLPGGAAPEAAAASASPLAPETGRPSGAPAGTAGLPTRKRPFTGSPAERWAAGADAIEVPKAKAVAGVSAARIETALRLTKDFLVASNLDREVLNGAQPKKALALIDPLQKDYLSELRAGLRRPTVENDPTWTFTRFDPDRVELVGPDVRVRGRMTVEPGGTAGQALIRADYTFVYPLARAGGGKEVVRTIVRRIVEVNVPDPVKFQATEGHIWVHDLNAEISNDNCRDGDGRIQPMFQADLYADRRPSGEAVDPYDRSRGLDGAGDECGTVSRT